MPPHVMTEEKIEVVRQRREHVNRFVQTYRESIGHDSSDA